MGIQDHSHISRVIDVVIYDFAAAAVLSLSTLQLKFYEVLLSTISNKQTKLLWRCSSTQFYPTTAVTKCSLSDVCNDSELRPSLSHNLDEYGIIYRYQVPYLYLNLYMYLCHKQSLKCSYGKGTRWYQVGSWQLRRVRDQAAEAV